MAFLHYAEAQDVVFCHTCVIAIRQKKILLSHNAATPICKFIILGIIALSLYMPVLLVIYSMHLNLNCFLSSSLKTSKGFSYGKILQCSLKAPGIQDSPWGSWSCHHHAQDYRWCGSGTQHDPQSRKREFLKNVRYLLECKVSGSPRPRSICRKTQAMNQTWSSSCTYVLKTIPRSPSGWRKPQTSTHHQRA